MGHHQVLGDGIKHDTLLVLIRQAGREPFFVTLTLDSPRTPTFDLWSTSLLPDASSDHCRSGFPVGRRHFDF